MNLSRARQLTVRVLAVLAVAWGSASAYSHWSARAIVAPMPVGAPAPATVGIQQLDGAALNMLFGLAPTAAAVASAAAFTLRASMVAVPGPSRALLAGSEGERFYHEGDRLPDGSLLRAVYPNRVVLWRNGREETLERPATAYFKSRAPAPASGSGLIRPAAEAGDLP